MRLTQWMPPQWACWDCFQFHYGPLAVCMIMSCCITNYQLFDLLWLLSVEDLPDLCKEIVAVDVVIKRAPCLDRKNFFGTPYLERHFLIEVVLTPLAWQTSTQAFHVSLNGLLNALASKKFVLQHAEL